MELRVQMPSMAEMLISFNHEELKEQMAEKVANYENLIYTPEQVLKEGRTDRANLNKVIKALSDERIRVKKEYMKPYEIFEGKIKEVEVIAKNAISNIDSQIKTAEKQKKQDKLDEITKFFNSTDHPEWLHIAQIMYEKWLNASVSMKSIQEEINLRLELIKNDVATLSNLPEFGFEATEVYKTTLDINKALNEGHRLSEIQKRKVEHEAEQARLKAEARPTTPIGQAIASIERQAFERCMHPPVEEAPAKQWVSFSALLSTEDAMALRDFFSSRNIEFKAV